MWTSDEEEKTVNKAARYSMCLYRYAPLNHRERERPIALFHNNESSRIAMRTYVCSVLHARARASSN